MGTRRVEARARVCDGQWHAVRAKLSPRSAVLALDAAPEERAPPALATLPSVVAVRPPSIYVGGLPGKFI